MLVQIKDNSPNILNVGVNLLVFLKIIEALGGKTALSRKHHSEINQFEII
jgi:hypothetical protein